MNKLPLELADKVFEFMPLREIVFFNHLTKQSREAAIRHLKRRCEMISLSSVHPLRDCSLKHIFEKIGPFVRQIAVDLITDKTWVPHIFEKCPQLDALDYAFRVDHVPLSDMSKLVSLTFFQIECDEEMITSYLTNRCRNLISLSLDRTECTGSCLTVAPTGLRHFNFTNSKLEFRYVADYIRRNQNIEDFCIQLEDEPVDMDVILENLPKVKQLGLIGKQIINVGWEKLAQMPKLNRLDMQITNYNFYKYAEAIDETQKLTELNITIDDFIVTFEFAECFERFIHLTKLSICIGTNVDNPQFIVPHLNFLGKNHKLKSLVLAGSTEYLDLSENNEELKDIKELRLCNPSTCVCKDHFAIYYDEV